MKQTLSVNLTISQQSLQLFIKYSKYFRRAVVNNCTCKCDFQNSYFLQRAAVSEYLKGLSGYCCFWEQLLLRGSI